MSRRRLAAAVLGAFLSIAPAVAANAYWTRSGSGTGTVTAGTLNAPTGVTMTNPSGGTVHVSWTAPTAPGGGSVTGYYVTRTVGGATAAACSTSATTLTTATSCDDTVTQGQYTYTVTAVYKTWTAASSPSSTITIGDVTPPTVSSIARTDTNPSVSNGALRWTVTFSETVTGVVAAEFATVAGTGISGTPAVTGVTGSGAVWTVTATTGNGSGTLGLNLVDHDAIADGAGNKLGGAGSGNGNATGAVYTLDRTITSVTLVNGGTTAGSIEALDQIVITFSRAMNWTTICSKWIGGVDTNAGGTKPTVSLNNGTTGNDTLTVTATTAECASGLHFGTIDLGATTWTTTLRTFGPTNSLLTFNTTTNTLTLKLGNRSGAVGTVSANTTPIYTADAAILDGNAKAVTNSPFTLSSQKWF